MDIDGKIMMKTLKYTLACMFIALSTCMTSYAQERISEGLEIDKTVHNFGDIMLDSGPVSCTSLANQTGVDLEQAMERNFRKKTERDSERHKLNPKL